MNLLNIQYHTYWDMRSAAEPPMTDVGVIRFAAIFVLILGMAALLLSKRLPLQFRRSVPYGVMGLGALLMASYFYIDYAKKSTPATSKQTATSEIRTVEGPILKYQEKIINAPNGGTQTVASFEVNKVSFHFSGVNHSGQKEFNLTRRKGGILENGMLVRITYATAQNKILKIELQKK